MAQCDRLIDLIDQDVIDETVDDIRVGYVQDLITLIDGEDYQDVIAYAMETHGKGSAGEHAIMHLVYVLMETFDTNILSNACIVTQKRRFAQAALINRLMNDLYQEMGFDNLVDESETVS